MPQGLSVGVRLPRELPLPELVTMARAVERAGLDELWLVEDCFYAGGIATAATVLASTETIPVGLGVLPAVARNPAIAAMELAALAELYPGRLIAGFGHGVPSWMRQIGAYPDSPLAALEETLSAVRRLLAGERVSMSGRHVRLDEVELESPPARVPPLFAGVRRPKSLAISGAVADGTLLAEPAPVEYVRAARDGIERGRGPDSPADHTLACYNWFAMDADPARAIDRVRADVLAGLSPGAMAHLEPAPYGAELQAAVKESGGIEELARRVRPEWIDQLSIAGDLEHCVARVRALHEAGCGSVILLPVLSEPIAPSIAAAGELAAELRRAG